MQLIELKKELFGYRKSQVHHYVDELNADFSDRIDKLEAQHQRQLAALEQRNAELAAALERSEQENQRYHDSYHAIADSLIDAKTYADLEKHETQRRENEARGALKQTYEKGTREAQAYLSAVEACRDQLLRKISEIEQQLASNQRSLADMLDRGVLETAAMEKEFDVLHAAHMEQARGAVPGSSEPLPQE